MTEIDTPPRQGRRWLLPVCLGLVALVVALFVLEFLDDRACGRRNLIIGGTTYAETTENGCKLLDSEGNPPPSDQD